jgi:hypothetical protein
MVALARGGSAVTVREYGKILVYPARGRLLFATDFHGQLRDFQRMAARFSARRAQGEDLYLLFAGDFIHGPQPGRVGRWLEEDESPALLDALAALLEAHPGRVHSLLGNHEHAHLGGASTQKFYRGLDNDVTALDRRLGVLGRQRACAMFRSFSLLALAPCGVLFTHAAPNLEATDDLLHRLAAVSYDGRDENLLGLIWPRGVRPDRIDAVLIALRFKGIYPRVSAYGHEVVPSGVDRSEHRQIVVSTSFAVADRVKTFLELDLAAHYEDTDDLRDGRELVRLYPERSIGVASA